MLLRHACDLFGRSALPQHQHHLTCALRSVCHHFAGQFIAQHLSISLHTGYHLRLVREHGSVQILHNSTHRIDQSAVVRVNTISNPHMTVAHHIQTLTNRVLSCKQCLGKTLRNQAFVGCIECRFLLSFFQLKVEEIEEGGVCQHNDTMFIVAHFPLPILDFSRMAKDAACFLHIRTHFLHFRCHLRPHEEAILAAHHINPIRILMPCIDAELTPRVVANENDEHERHGQSYDIDSCVELISRQEFQITFHLI